MKKKETILVILMGIITVAVILMGFKYNQDRQQALLNEGYEEISQTESFEERQRKKEEEKRAAFLVAFDENREESTLADFLQYVKYGQGDTMVTFFGEIEEDTQWAEEVLKNLAVERAFSEMKLEFVSTENLEETEESETAIEDQVTAVVALDPNVVFFHVPHPIDEIVDWTWDGLPVEENNIDDIFLTYDLMKSQLPEALIVMVTPAPNENVGVDEEAEEARVASRHQEGIDEVIAMNEEYGIPVFNIHDQMMAHLAANDLTIESLYNEEGQMTAEAQTLKADLFTKNLKEARINTTSAYILDGEPAEIDIVIEVYEEEEEAEEVESEEESSDEIVEDEPTWVPPVVEEEEEESTWTPPPTQPTQPTPPPTLPEEEISSEETVVTPAPPAPAAVFKLQI